MSQPQQFSEFMVARQLPLRRFATVLTGDPRTADEIADYVFTRMQPAGPKSATSTSPARTPAS